MKRIVGFGPHLTIDAKKCGPGRLTSFELVYDVLDKLPDLIGMTKIEPPRVVKWVDEWSKSGVPGISGFVMIAESHISIHTFPDEDYVFIDVFSCKPFDVSQAKDFLIHAFKAQEATVHMVERGKDFPHNKAVIQ